MPTTTTRSPSPRPPRRDSSSPVRTGEGLALAVAASLLLAAAPEQPRREVMLMTGLPLMWGEKGPFDPGSRPAAAYTRLQGEFDLQLVDVLDPATLARGRLLLLAQPKRLAPAELAALDAWIRSGGRALILTDPMLTWPSELPHGDIRRPPPVGLLAPLLGHWGLTLTAPAEAGEVEGRWKERRVLLDSPGRLRSAGPDCIAEEEWTALCRLGRGTVRLVADADLMRDPLWTSSRADNPAVVGEWLDSLAGLSRARPAPAELDRAGPAIGLLAILAALAVLAGIGLLLRRLRKR